eukprot:1879026-Prymnesium_polylepis.1
MAQTNDKLTALAGNADRTAVEVRRCSNAAALATRAAHHLKARACAHPRRSSSCKTRRRTSPRGSPISSRCSPSRRRTQTPCSKCAPATPARSPSLRVRPPCMPLLSCAPAITCASAFPALTARQGGRL